MPFQTIPPDGTNDTADANWRALQQSITSGAFNPIAPSTTITITGTGANTQGYFTTAVNNAVFFNITFAATSGNVTVTIPSGQFFILPQALFPLGSKGTGTVNYPYATFPVIIASTGATSGTLSLGVSGKSAVLINNTGATITAAAPTVSIHGFYFTGK